jgi:hypothetical protein
MVQTHFVNATTQVTPGVGEALVNFYLDRTTPNPTELGTVFATNQNIRVCPGSAHQTFTASCRFARDPVTIIGANGHFHSRGTDFQIASWDATAGAGQPFYDNTSWDDPLFLRDLTVPIAAGGGISYTCEFNASPQDCGDPADGCCFTFGGKVEPSSITIRSKPTSTASETSEFPRPTGPSIRRLPPFHANATPTLPWGQLER